jgi:hypothetical protein
MQTASSKSLRQRRKTALGKDREQRTWGVSAIRGMIRTRSAAYLSWNNACQEHPLVAPQVSHFRQVPLRIRVKLPHSSQLSPS